ncbi:hypothetical protein Terro_4090 [Terriglobus roseus DSM 18391]|uniref:Uncharacterized protein n=1 Tax=Terriglobus roseus (strain DSM 18391 / NRRL B-41598 / KBS 63) TaxID=926566 RepID=I3ZM29_TERRK|nr:hypothetical protein [Terriglobus roseus]AFL90297.1 hypothetical protein Terro_4090 [Terriglobus roseus DSM 18391]
MADTKQLEESSIGVTTVEANHRRHLVRPYEDRPVVELAEGVVACPLCGNPRFRRSRLRFTDFAEILMMRYPVRCTRCGQRQYTDFNVAMMSFPPRPVGGHRAERQDTWKNWTDPSMPSQPVARPLSTAQGPRARNLNAPKAESDLA